MNSRSLQPVPTPTQTCIERFEQAWLNGAGRCSSPLFALLDVLRRLQDLPERHGPLVINDRADNQRGEAPISAWPLWFSDRAARDRPLFYLTQSPTSAHLSMLSQQIGERGIVLNDLESSPSRWAKGAHPWLPLWLAGNQQCLPFDPACGQEALAIVAGALRSLYIEGRPGFCYLTLHDESAHWHPGADPDGDRHQAWLGMYRLGRSEASGPPVRLLGAGQMLGEVRAAAQLLEQDWGVACELWSCPSYTRLARDAEAARAWNRRHADQPARRCHLLECLGQGEQPVLAVTGYAEFVAGQIGAHLPAPFRALGADSLAPGQRLDRYWLVYSALQMLVSTGQLERDCLDEALRLYRLV